MNSAPDNLLDKKETAARLKVCTRTVDYWRKKKSLPYVKVGGSIRFLPADIEGFINSRRVGT